MIDVVCNDKIVGMTNKVKLIKSIRNRIEGSSQVLHCFNLIKFAFLFIKRCALLYEISNAGTVTTYRLLPAKDF